MRGGRGRQSGRRPCCAAAMGASMAGGVAAAGAWVAPMAADLASCPDPSRFGLGRPVARGGPVRGGWRLPAGVPTAALVSTARLRSVPASYEVGGTRLPMKIAPTLAMADDGGVYDVVPFSRHRRCKSWHPTRDAPGETLDLDLPDRTMMVPLMPLSLLRASFWSKCWLDGTSGRTVSHPSQGRRRILVAWRCGGSATGACGRIRAGWWSCLASWWRRRQARKGRCVSSCSGDGLEEDGGGSL